MAQSMEARATAADTPSAREIERVAEKLWDIVIAEGKAGNSYAKELMARAINQSRMGSVRGEPL